MKGSYFGKIAGFFPTILAKINTVTGIFQGLYLDFKQFSFVCNISRIFPVFPMADSLNFKITFQ